MSNGDFDIYANYVRRQRKFAARVSPVGGKSVRNGSDSGLTRPAAIRRILPLKPLAAQVLLCQ